jgi:hypothetical protein
VYQATDVLDWLIEDRRVVVLTMRDRTVLYAVKEPNHE